MKVEHRGGMKNKSNTAGFVNIEDFEGATMRISVELLKQGIATIENIGEGVESEYINIGIPTFKPEGTSVESFLIFLDPKKTLAYVVMGVDKE